MVIVCKIQYQQNYGNSFGTLSRAHHFLAHFLGQYFVNIVLIIIPTSGQFLEIFLDQFLGHSVHIPLIITWQDFGFWKFYRKAFCFYEYYTH